MTNLLLALALTLIIEVPIGAILLKRKDSVIPLVLINILTNPAMNAVLLLLFSLTRSYTVYFSALIFGELAVFIGEGFLLHTLCDLPKKRALILSTIINASSLFLGSAMLSFI
ncbi:MAG: hypothetical protein J6S71_08215 [Clostridia bacterium]|nr:hypothetical protein [Clostridia bacterium]